MRIRTAASSAVAIGALVGAVVLSGVLPGVGLAQSAEASFAVPSELIPTPLPPTETMPTPCETAPIPPQLPPSAAATSEAPPSFFESSLDPSVTTVVPIETPSELAGPCESVAPSEGPIASESASAFCALLTTDEIEAVIGAPVIAGSGDETSCVWATADPNSDTLVVVGDVALSDFDELKSTNLPGMVNAPVNVGDDAFAETLNDTVTTLYMKKGDRGIQVLASVANLTQNDTVTIESKLAQLIAGRI